MRALAGEAESAPAYNEAQARWAAEMAYQRRLVSRYRQSFIRHALKDIDWESSAKEEYRANAARYMRPDLVKASHILVKVEERSEREALDLIESLHGKLLEGADFAALAREFSEDSSAQGGGNLGYFKYGTMDPAFESAVFELQENGDISKPVRSQFGYHIIMLTGRKEGQKIPYEEVKADIIDGLQTKMGDRLWQEKIVRLRSSPDIVYDQRTLTGLRQKYDKPAPGGNGK